MTSHANFPSVACFFKIITRAIPFFCAALSLPANAQVFNNLHSLVFLDGTGPVANLIWSSNTLYGTTRIYGGGNAGGYGSVFSMNLNGSGFTNLHTFSAIAPEAGNLNSGLILFGGKLYGTATFGGSSNYGSVFAIGTNGLGLTNLFNFESTGPDFPYPNNIGAYPIAGLTLIGNTFYGLANGGGTNGGGTLFAMNTNGTGFTNLHNFSFATGNNPSRDLLYAGGVFYGTTFSGGDHAVGTVFKINTNGSGFTNFYNFSQTSGPDRTNYEGAFPACSLVLAGTNLYGTVAEGAGAEVLGKSPCCFFK